MLVAGLRGSGAQHAARMAGGSQVSVGFQLGTVNSTEVEVCDVWLSGAGVLVQSKALMAWLDCYFGGEGTVEYDTRRSICVKQIAWRRGRATRIERLLFGSTRMLIANGAMRRHDWLDVGRSCCAVIRILPSINSRMRFFGNQERASGNDRAKCAHTSYAPAILSPPFRVGALIQVAAGSPRSHSGQ